MTGYPENTLCKLIFLYVGLGSESERSSALGAPATWTGHWDLREIPRSLQSRSASRSPSALSAAHVSPFLRIYSVFFPRCHIPTDQWVSCQLCAGAPGRRWTRGRLSRYVAGSSWETECIRSRLQTLRRVWRHMLQSEGEIVISAKSSFCEEIVEKVRNWHFELDED